MVKMVTKDTKCHQTDTKNTQKSIDTVHLITIKKIPIIYSTNSHPQIEDHFNVTDLSLVIHIVIDVDSHLGHWPKMSRQAP